MATLSLGTGIQLGGRQSLSLGEGVGVASLGVLAINSGMFVTSNSYGSASDQVVGVNDHRRSRWSVPTSFLEYIGNKWRVGLNANRGVSGVQSSTGTNNVAGQLAGGLALVSAPFVWLCPERFLNDVKQATTAATGIADYVTDITTVVNAGGRCIIGTCPPERPDGSSTYTAPQITKISDFNTGVRALASKNVKVIDYDLVGLVLADYSDDIHLTTNGWDKVAAWVVSSGLLADWLPSGKLINSLSTEYTDNPDCTGGNATAPAGWTFDASNLGGATHTWDTTLHRVTITGTVVGTGHFLDIFRSTGSAPLPAVVDKVEALFDYDIVSQTGLLAIYSNVTIYDGGFATLAFSGSHLNAPAVAQTDESMARALGNYVNRGPQTQVQAGTPTYRATGLKFYVLPGTVNTTIQFNRLTSQKVV